MRGAAGASGLPELRGGSSGGVALRAIAQEWASRSAEGDPEHGSRVRLYAKGLACWTGQDTEERLEPRSIGNTRSRLLPERSLRKLGGAPGGFGARRARPGTERHGCGFAFQALGPVFRAGRGLRPQNARRAPNAKGAELRRGRLAQTGADGDGPEGRE